MKAIEKIEEEALKQMCERGGKWAAYQNQALDSNTCGELRFLQFGENCTFNIPPKRYPDTQFGIGWRYGFVGLVNLASGEVESCGENT